MGVPEKNNYKTAELRLVDQSRGFESSPTQSTIQDIGTQVIIHPSAVVSKQAIIGEGTVIGPFTVIGSDVRIGKRNRIGAHVVIDGYTSIGDDNLIYQFASVGAAPQDKKFKGEASTLEIGSKNVIREFVTLQPGTEGGGMRTLIGSGNLFMANCHVGHDCVIGNDNVFANSAALAGHVTIYNRVTVGGLSGIHQFARIGDMAMLGGGAMVAQDIPPYCIAQGDRAKLVGINTIGLQRAGFNDEQIKEVKLVFRKAFMSKREESLDEIAKKISDTSPARTLLEFIRNSERGVAALRSGSVD